MKNFISLNFVIAFLFLPFINNPITPDSRVIDYLGNEKVNIIQKNNPDLIRYYNFFLDNAYTISTVPQEKLDDNNLPILTLPIKNGKVDISKLNILKLEIQRKFDNAVYYKVKNTKELIIFLSEKDFMVKYNKYRKELGLIKE